MTRGKNNMLHTQRDLKVLILPIAIAPPPSQAWEFTQGFFIHISSWLIVKFSSDSNFFSSNFFHLSFVNEQGALVDDAPPPSFFHSHFIKFNCNHQNSSWRFPNLFHPHFIEFDCEHKQMRSSSWWCPSLFHLHFIEFDYEHKLMKSFGWYRPSLFHPHFIQFNSEHKWTRISGEWQPKTFNPHFIELHCELFIHPFMI